MNNDVKNFLIVILSLIVLVQSAFLAVLLSRRSLSSKKPHVASKVFYRDPLKKTLPAADEKKSEVLPLVAKEDVRPLAPRPQSLGKIAIVLDDWGYNLRNKNFITGNSFRLTLSILPHQAYSAQVAQLAHEHGKEVMIHMPMEPNHKEQLGLEKKTLLTSMDKKTIVRLLEEARENVPYAAGVNNHMGSAATTNARLMRIVFEFLKKNNLFFLDSFVTSGSVCRSLSAALGLEFAQRDVFIDNEDEPDAIRAQMAKLAAAARRNGTAVAIGHDRPATIAVLEEMIPRLQQEGYQFVGISEVVRGSASSEPR